MFLYLFFCSDPRTTDTVTFDVNWKPLRRISINSSIEEKTAGLRFKRNRLVTVGSFVRRQTVMKQKIVQSASKKRMFMMFILTKPVIFPVQVCVQKSAVHEEIDCTCPILHVFYIH